MNFLLARRPSTELTIVGVAVFLTVFANFSFFSRVLQTFPLATHALPVASLALALIALQVLLLGLLAIGRATKGVLIAMLFLSALAAYFMDSFGIHINREMLENAVQTNPQEALDLLTGKLVVYLVVLGLLPALALGRLQLSTRSAGRALLARLLLLFAAVVVLVGCFLAFGSFYVTFGREHKSLRSGINPGYPIYSLVQLARHHWSARDVGPPAVIGADARIPPHQDRELVILVVGETARADHFSLNGYARETNPELAREKVISLTDFHACGTSTVVSVPCMFSLAGSRGEDVRRENLLDVMQRAGVHVLWRDNNSDSKGVALRVPYENFQSPAVNPVCDVECRDIGMLSGLQDFIDRHPAGDILIVLHQMGNHGPAYYKRYPSEFEVFKPACRNNDLSQCSREEIVNAYDNALRYTDHFLAQTIALLKRNDKQFETALFYLSDHGESLGEGGIYLHGMPKAIAPEPQLHVPAILWFGENFDEIDRAALAKKRSQPFTHDNLFHTLLGFMEIETGIYRPDMDILTGARRPDRK